MSFDSTRGYIYQLNIGLVGTQPFVEPIVGRLSYFAVGNFVQIKYMTVIIPALPDLAQDLSY